MQSNDDGLGSGKAHRQSQIEIVDLKANDMTFRCRLCGRENRGDPVVLLHGFPETSCMWERLLLSLASSGYKCLAPDLRGYSPGARPTSKASYRINEIASDVVALTDAVGFQTFHLIGHDWGSACGWTVVELYAERVNSWTALSVPHMAAFYAARKTDPDQKQRSWYMDAFQIPVIPEMVLGWAIAWIPSLFWEFASDAEIADYLTVFREFNGRSASINWYRANQELPIHYGDVYLPTLMVWGNRDIAIGRAGVDMSQPYMKGDYVKIELDAGHFLIQEQFERINRETLNHLQQHSTNN
jgi:pimeloyl-ACP methyl ester carboxylesterase